MHLPLGREAEILAMGQHRHPKHPGILQGMAHNVGFADRFAIIRKSHTAGCDQIRILA